MSASTWHILTSEYPPQLGGVSDYTHLVASELARAGDVVHVWCPYVSPNPSAEISKANVQVHRELGRIAPSDLQRVGELLDQFPAPRRLLIQWVPHGYGYRSMNLPLCLWLWNRAHRRHDVVEILAHECFLPFKRRAWKHNLAAFMQRLMTIVLLRTTRRVWVTIPAWEGRWRPFALGRRVAFEWLPVASNIEVVEDSNRAATVRTRYASDGEQVVGHFGTYDRNVSELLSLSVPSLLEACRNCVVLLLGRGSTAMRDQLISSRPEIASRVHAAGTLAAADLSNHIKACDLMLQPYIDGVSSRRTSVMVGLSHGKPIVTTNGTLTESLWAESRAVALVPVDDRKGLIRATEALLVDEESRRQMSIRAKDLYDERFAVQRTIAAMRETSGQSPN